MKLSEIVAFKNLLDNIASIALIRVSTNADLQKIIRLTEVQQFLPNEYKNKIQEEYNQLQCAFDSINESVTEFQEQLQKYIAQRELYYYQTSIENYYTKINLYQESGFYTAPYVTPWGVLKTLPATEWNHSYIADTVKSITNQKSLASEDFIKAINDRTLSYTDWQYPAAVLRPAHIPFINTMVANDPLYLIDEHPDLLTPTVQQFNTQYQNRLRTYVINEVPKRPILDKLPSKQFVFFLAFNYFNYRPFEVIKQYLEEIFQLLRPGGVVGMTFNDCDRYFAVGLVENHSACYTPGHILLNMAKNIGYKCIFRLDEEDNTWIELQKPGGLASIKGGQTLAKITYKQ